MCWQEFVKSSMVPYGTRSRTVYASAWRGKRKKKLQAVKQGNCKARATWQHFWPLVEGNSQPTRREPVELIPWPHSPALWYDGGALPWAVPNPRAGDKGAHWYRLHSLHWCQPARQRRVCKGWRVDHESEANNTQHMLSRWTWLCHDYILQKSLMKTYA